MSEIFEIGSQDEDEWVCVLLEILKYYLSIGILNVYFEYVSLVFVEVVEEIRKIGKIYICIICLLVMVL